MGRAMPYRSSPRHPARSGLPPLCAVVVAQVLAAFGLAAQAPAARTAPAPTDTVVAIRPPATPLPDEAASGNVTRFSFLVYGDTRGRRDGVEPQYEHSLVVESMLRTIASLAEGPDPIRFVLQSGDAVVNGRVAQQWNVSFVPIIDRLTSEGDVPYFLAPGNHDVPSGGRAEGLGNYLSAVANLIPPEGSPRRLAGYPTYAFGYGNVFVVGLDSNIADDSTQYAWVTTQLQGLDRTRYTHVVAFFHHPAFSSGPHGAARVEAPTAAIRALYMPLFRRYHVELLFVGHEHLFEHWVERYRDEQGTWRRIDQVVTGGGGAPLYAYRGEPDLGEYETAAAADPVRVTHLVRPGMMPGDNPYHYVIVHVDGARTWLEVVGVDWGRGFQPYRSARAVLSDTAGAG